jgi:hypothetical protein
VAWIASWRPNTQSTFRANGDPFAPNAPCCAGISRRCSHRADWQLTIALTPGRNVSRLRVKRVLTRTQRVTTMHSYRAPSFTQYGFWALCTLMTGAIGCADAPPAEEAVGESRWGVAECDSGHFLDTTRSPAVCISCTPVSNCVSSVTCTAASNSQCSQCEEGRWLSNSLPSVCSPCTPVPFCTSALICTDANDSTCSSCAPGHYLDDRQRCTPCAPVPFCQSALLSCTNGNDSTCSSCAPGYYLDGGSCTPCQRPSGCVGAVACTNAMDATCTECDAGYFLDTAVAPAVCKSCTPVSACVSSVTCTTASNSQCTQCAEGRWLSNSLPSVCLGCSPAPNCASAVSCTGPAASVCAACLPGYRLAAGACVNIDECSDNTDTCSPFASCTDTLGSFACACNAGYSGDGMACTPSCGGFGADPLLWGQPLARDGQIVDTDPSAGGTLKYRYQRGSTIPVKVRALDCSRADITSKPSVRGTVHVYADLGCDGVADQELQTDCRTSSPGTMKKADGFLAYQLDTSELPRSPACFVLEVVVRDTTTGNQAREQTLLQRK